jgi:hypothetical protein
MAAVTVFYQSCPVCGRTLRIPAKYFGRQMSCTHCEGEFRAGNDELKPQALKSQPTTEQSFADPVMSLPLIQPQLGEV